MQLIGNGIGHQEATSQSQQWHPPMVIPFTNPTNGQEDGQDEAARGRDLGTPAMAQKPDRNAAI